MLEEAWFWSIPESLEAFVTRHFYGRKSRKTREISHLPDPSVRSASVKVIDPVGLLIQRNNDEDCRQRLLSHGAVINAMARGTDQVCRFCRSRPTIDLMVLSDFAFDPGVIRSLLPANDESRKVKILLKAFL